MNKTFKDGALVDVPVANPDSKLMQNMLHTARFIVNMKEATMNTIADEVILAELQEMINSQTVDCMFATVTMILTLIEKGKLTPPSANFAAKFMSKPKSHH